MICHLCRGKVDPLSQRPYLLISTRVLYILISALEAMVDVEPGVGNKSGLVSSDDRRECNYLLQTLSNVITALSHSGWVILLSHSLHPTENAGEPLAPEG